jgi:chorismate lyase
MLNSVPFPTTEKHLTSPLCFSTIIETELYRDVQGIYCGDSVAWESAFEQSGPVWGRHYLFWHHGKPLTLIYEVFSPYLTKYLGPMQLDVD